MKITSDEGWREITEALTNLLMAYDVSREKCLDIICDIGSELETVVREYNNE